MTRTFAVSSYIYVCLSACAPDGKSVPLRWRWPKLKLIPFRSCSDALVLSETRSTSNIRTAGGATCGKLDSLGLSARGGKRQDMLLTVESCPHGCHTRSPLALFASAATVNASQDWPCLQWTATYRASDRHDEHRVQWLHTISRRP